MLTVIVSNDTNSWYVDSGATKHVCCQQKFFITLRKCDNIEIQIADNKTINVTAIGNCRINLQNGEFILSNVLYAPEVFANFISPIALAEENYDTLITKRDGKVCSLTFYNQQICFKAEHHDGLLKLINCEKEHLYVTKTKVTDEIIEWHRKLGHVNFADLRRLAERFNVKVPYILPQCMVCECSKASRKPFFRKEIKSKRILELIHSDLSGIIRQWNLHGYKYYLLLIDDYSRYVTCYLIRSKSDTFKCFEEFVTLTERQMNVKMMALISDNGTEYTSSDFQAVIKANGLVHYFTNAGCPETNGVSERGNKTICQMATALLKDAGLPAYLWPEAIEHAVFIRNRVPSSAINYQVPYDLWHKKSPDYKRINRFGCAVVMHDPTITGAFDGSGSAGFFVGYPKNKSGILVFLPDKRKVVSSRNVVFLRDNAILGEPLVAPVGPDNSNASEFMEEDDEQVTDDEEDAPGPNRRIVGMLFNEEGEQNAEQLIYVTDPESETQNWCELFSESHEQVCAEADEGDDQNQVAERSAGYDSLSERQVRPVEGSETSFHMPEAQSTQLQVPAVVLTEPEAIMTRRQINDWRNEHQNESYTLQVKPGAPMKIRTEGRGAPSKGYRCQITHRLSVIRPKTLVDRMLDGPDGRNWHAAMTDEYNSLIDNQTWRLVPKQKNMRVIDSMWLLTRKDTVEGVRFKARFVARGFNQEVGIDYVDSYAPTLRSMNVHFLFSFGMQSNMLIEHVDIKTAYLNAKLDQTLYMRQPYKFESSRFPGHVCELQKSIYGLKQSAHCWHKYLTGLLNEFGLSCLSIEKTIFANKSRSIVIGIYVDDMLVLASDYKQMNKAKNFIRTRLKITDNGNVKLFLGLSISRNEFQLKISAEKYISKVLDELNMKDCCPASSPIVPDTQLSDATGQLLPDQQVYNSLIGKLQYVSVVARPDIRYATGLLATFRQKATDFHLTAAKRVLKYLKKTISSGTVYKRSEPVFTIYADSDYGNINHKGQCTVGICAFHGSNLVFWSSGRLTTVCCSTCEAEAKAIKEAAKLAKYYFDFSCEFYGVHNTKPITIFNDNLPAVNLCNCQNEKFTQSKHYLLDVFYIRDCLDKKIITIHHSPGHSMIADALTKPLSAPKMFDLWTSGNFDLVSSGSVKI